MKRFLPLLLIITLFFLGVNLPWDTAKRLIQQMQTVVFDSLTAKKVKTDSLNTTCITIGDTSNAQNGTIIDRNAFHFFGDTLKFYQKGMVPFPHWLNLYSMIYSDGDRATLLIESKYSGNGEVVIRTDECKPDTNEVHFFRTQIYPALDTLDKISHSFLYSKLGSPHNRWGEAFIRHFYSTTPDKAGSLHIFMDVDSARFLSENPILFDNNIAIRGNLTIDTILGNPIVQIGDAGSTSHSLSSNDDLFVSGKLEVDGSAYFDATTEVATFGKDPCLRITKSSLIYGAISSYTDDGIYISPIKSSGRANHNVIITSYSNLGIDHDHDTVSTNPTLFIHSATDPDVDNTQWISISHNQTDGVIDVGKGNVVFPSGIAIEDTLKFTAGDTFNLFSSNDTFFVDAEKDAGYLDLSEMTVLFKPGWMEFDQIKPATNDSSSSSIGWSDNPYGTGYFTDLHTIGNLTVGDTIFLSNIKLNTGNFITTMKNIYYQATDSNLVINYRVPSNKQIQFLYYVPPGYRWFLAYDKTYYSIYSYGTSSNRFRIICDTTKTYIYDTLQVSGDLTVQGDIKKISGTDTTIINENGIYSSSSPWYYCKYMDAFSLASGGSGATLVTPDGNTLGGYNLDSDNEYLYFNAAVCNNWDGASDPIVIVIWETDVDNSGGGANDSVELDLQCWFKGEGETLNKSQSLSERVEIGQSARYKQFQTIFTIDYDDGSNPVEYGDVFTCRVNFDRTNSDITDIVINFVRFAYRCNVPNPKAY